jgi:hypothetical protein
MKRLLAALALSTALCASAAEPPLPQYSHDQTLGVGDCTNSLCHGSAQHWTDSRVLQNEYLIWSRRDKHARTYAVLLNDRSQEIAKKLGLTQPPQNASLCLDCHAHNVPPARREPKFVLSDGIACEACHGPAERWIRSHVEPNATHAQNLANGMYATSDDVQRARLCMSCHFGTADKFVDHRLIAAGHPRLSFELDTFMQIEPQHFRIDDDWVERKGRWDTTRAWAVGHAMGAAQLLHTLVDSKRGHAGLFPELSLFDCHACHHLMSDKRDFHLRNDVGLGRVRLNDSSLLMLRQIVARVDAAGAPRFNAQLDRLQRAIAGGDDALAQARATLQECDQALARIVAYRHFSADDLRAMLDGLLEQGLNGDYSSYQSAEQATMAVQSMTDLMSRIGVVRAASVQPALTRLLLSVADDEQFRPQTFQAALRDLRAAIPAGKQK